MVKAADQDRIEAADRYVRTGEHEDFFPADDGPRLQLV